MLSKIKKGFKNPYLLLMHLGRQWPWRHLISDKQFVSLFYRAYHHRPLNLTNPQTFNEKLQWLKLYDRKEEYTQLTDKYLVRQYVKEKIGEQYLVPLLAVWDRPEDINFSKLPNQFVLKCNHDSHSVVICRDKETLDKKAAIKKLLKAFNTQYFWKGREHNYKNIQRKIIAEKYITDQNSDELTDYKYFCFNGIPYFVQVDSNRFTNHTRNFYDIDWNFINVEYGCKNNPFKIDPKPKAHEKILQLASILAAGIPHVRVDFYVLENHIYFGELTFHHGGGGMMVSPQEYDQLWGSYLVLPNKNNAKN